MKPERITVEVQTDASGMARILDKARAQKATAEPAGPSGSLRCDGVVGLRAESAEALAQSWARHAVDLAILAEKHGAGFVATRRKLKASSKTYATCCEELRRLIAAETVRQPEPNTEHEQRGPKTGDSQHAK